MNTKLKEGLFVALMILLLAEGFMLPFWGRYW